MTSVVSLPFAKPTPYRLFLPAVEHVFSVGRNHIIVWTSINITIDISISMCIYIDLRVNILYARYGAMNILAVSSIIAQAPGDCSGEIIK